MIFDKLIDYFLPDEVRKDKTHLRYDEFRVIISADIVGIFILALFPIFLFCLQKPFMGFYINVILLLCTLFSIKIFAHYRLPMTLTQIIVYYIIYEFVKKTGFIYSVNISFMHMFLLGTIWADKKYGYLFTICNLFIFIYIYYQTITNNVNNTVILKLDSPVYALVIHSLITIFLGFFLGYEQFDQEHNRKKLRELQDQKISLLDEAVKQRTDQLNNMRQALAIDFHDYTGNILSAITRQASILKIKLQPNSGALHEVDCIINNSNNLYSASRDFLWKINHNSDDPMELFNYLTGCGQLYYNQFDLAFSSRINGQIDLTKQLDPFAALNLIFIFKEAMNNVVKHANAGAVTLEMTPGEDTVLYTLQDDGKWQYGEESRPHYGLSNMRQRSEKNNFGFNVFAMAQGTRIEITVPLISCFCK